jgi:hypothetical protein
MPSFVGSARFPAFGRTNRCALITCRYGHAHQRGPATWLCGEVLAGRLSPLSRNSRITVAVLILRRRAIFCSAAFSGAVKKMFERIKAFIGLLPLEGAYTLLLMLTKSICSAILINIDDS